MTTNVYLFSLFAVSLLCAGVVVYHAFKRYGLIPALVVWLAITSSLRVWGNPFPPLIDVFSVNMLARFDSTAKDSLLIFALTMSAVMLTPPKAAITFFGFVALANVIMLFSPGYGILFNASMSGCFAAVLAGYFFEAPIGRWLFAATAVACIYTGQAQPVGVLAVVGVALWLPRLTWTKRAMAIALLAVVGVAAFRNLPPDAYSDNGRFEIYRRAWAWWRTFSSPWWGAGAGAFEVVGPMISRQAPSITPPFTWLHSDWLQVGFEQGAVGLVIAVAAFIRPLWRLRGPMLASWLGIGAWGVFNFPFRQPVSALFIALIGYQSVLLIYGKQDRASLRL